MHHGKCGNMNICVLGGTGYLGTRTIKKLLENETDGQYTIYSIYRKNSKSKKVFENNKNVHYIVSDYKILRDLFSKIKFNCIINFSCSYMRNGRIDDIMESNLIFPLRILSLATESYYNINDKDNAYTKKIKQGNQLRFISVGTALPDNFNIYTKTKKVFNDTGYFFSNEYGLEFINLQLENYFGEDEPKDRFLPSIIEKLKKNEDIPLTQGEQLRDFIYVEDVISAIFLFVCKKRVPPFVQVPLGSGAAPSIKELVMYLKHLMKSKSDLQFGKVPLRPNEPSSFANLEMYKLFGGKIKYSWKQGLKLMLKRENLI